MQPFGSSCFYLIQKPKKLENRSVKGIFIGYDRRSPDYLIYFPETLEIKRSDVFNFIMLSLRSLTLLGFLLMKIMLMTKTNLIKPKRRIIQLLHFRKTKQLNQVRALNLKRLQA